MAWIYRNLNPAGKHVGDCVIRAIAYATGKSWDEIFWGITNEAFDRAEMPSWNSTWWSYLEKQGFKRHIIPDLCPDCYSVEEFCEDHPTGTYVLYIPHSIGGVGHVVAAKNGNYIDSWDSGGETPLAYWRKEDGV